MCDHRQGGAVVLAGGDSKRLGRPKALLELGGKTLIRIVLDRLLPIFQQITVVTDRSDLFKELPVSLTGDLITGGSKTPLRGIHAGLSASLFPYQFFTACDMPFISPGLIRHMARYVCDHDVVVPRFDGHYQPLYAFYSRSCLEPIEKMLQGKELKITRLYDGLRVKHVGLEEIERYDPAGRSFFNINTQLDYDEALRLLTEGKESV